VNHTEQPFDEIIEERLFPRDLPEEGRVVVRIMHDGWEIGTWIEQGWEGAGPVAKRILAVNDLLAACELALPLAESQEGGMFDHRGDKAANAIRTAIAKATA